MAAGLGFLSAAKNHLALSSSRAARGGGAGSRASRVASLFSLSLQKTSLEELHTFSVTSNRAVVQQADRHPLRSFGLSAT